MQTLDSLEIDQIFKKANCSSSDEDDDTFMQTLSRGSNSRRSSIHSQRDGAQTEKFISRKSGSDILNQKFSMRDQLFIKVEGDNSSDYLSMDRSGTPQLGGKYTEE